MCVGMWYWCWFCFFVVKWHFLVQWREVDPFSFTLLPFVYAFSAAIYVPKSYSIWQLTTVMEILIWIVDSSSATIIDCCSGDIVTEGHSIWNSLDCQWKSVLQVEMKTMLKVFPSQRIMNCYYSLSPAKKHLHEKLKDLSFKSLLSKTFPFLFTCKWTSHQELLWSDLIRDCLLFTFTFIFFNCSVV